jgi:hypothetical protein
MVDLCCDVVDRETCGMEPMFASPTKSLLLSSGFHNVVHLLRPQLVNFLYITLQLIQEPKHCKNDIPEEADQCSSRNILKSNE